MCHSVSALLLGIEVLLPLLCGLLSRLCGRWEETGEHPWPPPLRLPDAAAPLPPGVTGPPTRHTPPWGRGNCPHRDPLLIYFRVTPFLTANNGGLPCTRHASATGEWLLLFAPHRRGTLGSERPGDLPKVTRLVDGGAGVQGVADWPPACVLAFIPLLSLICHQVVGCV